MSESWCDRLGAGESFLAGAEDCRDLGDSVLVLNYSAAWVRRAGGRSGKVQTRGASVFGLRESNVRRLVVYADGAKSFADPGLIPHRRSCVS